MNYIAPVSSACYAGLAADAQPPGERVDDSVKVHAGDTDAAHPLIVIPATRVSCWFLTSTHSLFHPRLTLFSFFSPSRVSTRTLKTKRCRQTPFTWRSTPGAKTMCMCLFSAARRKATRRPLKSCWVVGPTPSLSFALARRARNRRATWAPSSTPTTFARIGYGILLVVYTTWPRVMSSAMLCFLLGMHMHRHPHSFSFKMV